VVLAPLPVSTTTLFGREQEIGEVASLLARPGVRLVTLTGPGGVGKTRLAVAVAERLRESFGASTVFVSLARSPTPGRCWPGSAGRSAPTWRRHHWRRWPNGSATSGGCSSLDNLEAVWSANRR